MLQKILMGHPDIHSTAEPWLLFPFVYALKNNGVLSEYNHSVFHKAIYEFVQNLPQGEKDYYETIRQCVSAIYEKSCPGSEKYFLDKTPRYYLIIEEINKLFPEAKFIFLFRNPVQVFSSIVNTWCRGRLRRLYPFEIDLYYGPKALSKGYQLMQEKAYSVQYEELVKNPEVHVKEICNYLEIEYHPKVLTEFAKQETGGSMGDHKGQREYSAISKNSTSKWRSTFNTVFRKQLISKYLNSIDSSVLEVQGYDKQTIRDEIKNHKVSLQNIGLADLMDYSLSNLIRLLKLNLYFEETIKDWAPKRHLS